MLAGLVKNPVGLDPTVYPDRALSRRNTVLDRMAQLNVISEKRAAEDRQAGPRAASSPRTATAACSPSRRSSATTSSTTSSATPRWARRAADRQDLLLSGGLTIQTTIDLRFQKAADDSVKSHVFPREQAIGGLAMVEPRTGNVTRDRAVPADGP